MKLAVLFSGGKDSNYALYWALNQGFEVKYLVSVIPERDDSYMFHKPCIEHVRMQAKAIGIPLIQENVSGVKEKEVRELEDILASLHVDGIVSGAVASEYQKTRIDSICEKLGLKSYAPLWGVNQEKVLEDIINAGFEVIIVGIAAEGLSEKWLGRKINHESLQELKKISEKHGIHLAGEGGEYETYVTNGPTFKKKIIIKETEKKMNTPNTGTLKIKKAELT
ncbi:MAG: TIGR00289 family protein [Candidatus Altiarchaeales archaeon]|nr:TIGR00289 family protein [Candidatus Altiarchaeales archaeon]